MAKRKRKAAGKKTFSKTNGKTKDAMASHKHMKRSTAQRETRYLMYAVIVLVLLVLFAIEPGFFLGLIIGAVAYRYYVDHFK